MGAEKIHLSKVSEYSDLVRGIVAIILRIIETARHVSDLNSFRERAVY